MMALLSVLLLVIGTSTLAYANGLPGGRDVATQRDIHLYSQVQLINGSVDPNAACSITGNIFTFTHVLDGHDWQGNPCTYGALDSGCVGGWSSTNTATPTRDGRISGSFHIDKNPAPLYWDTPETNFIYVSFNAASHYVPPYGEYDLDHYNFTGNFKITGGAGFYEGIKGAGTISGTLHDHTWGPGDPGETWFDFVMIGKAFFP